MVTKISTKDMSREEWQKARIETIGGSDAAAVIGLNPYKSPYALWAEKSGKVVPEDISQKESVRLGVELEDYVARRFTEATGKKVKRDTAILKNDTYPFAHANVDRLVVGEKAGLECKTTSVLNLKKFKNGEYPSTYYAQCVHYMAVTGLKKWYLAVLILGQEFKVFEIERDEDEIKALMEAEQAFWHRVKCNIPPEINGSASDAETVSRMYPGSDTDRMIDLFGMDTALLCYKELSNQIKELTEQRDAYKLRICHAIGDNQGGYINGEAVTWKPQSRNTFQVDAFKKAHPNIDLTPFYKATTSRIFKVK